jgi:hypothetical protein
MLPGEIILYIFKYQQEYWYSVGKHSLTNIEKVNENVLSFNNGITEKWHTFFQHEHNYIIGRPLYITNRKKIFHKTNDNRKE